MSADAEAMEDIEFPLGDYRVLQLLGRGGIGEVFVAQRRGSTVLCALKRLRPDVKAMGAARARIRREAHLATYLDHPNLCRVLDAGNEEGSFFLASEFVRGVDLERLIQGLASRRLALALDMVMAVALPALAGLHHAHAARDPGGRLLGVVHRDLSPRNIMVTFDGQVKIIDFGIAHAKVDDYKTNPGVLLGTLKYLSPEQALGSAIDARSDLYAMGALLYEMFTGRSAVTSGQSLMEALEQIVNDSPPPVTDFNPRVPSAVTAILHKALAKKPQDRFQTAGQMAEALQSAAGPAATEAALGKLVQDLFPDVQARMQEVSERAHQNLTPPPRQESSVDPFSATSVGPSANEMSMPTRLGVPDEPDPERTRAVVHSELRQIDAAGQALLPTRLMEEPGLHAPDVATMAAMPSLSQTPASVSSLSAARAPTTGPGRWAVVAVLLALGITVTAAYFGTRPTAAPITTSAGAAPAPGVAPSAPGVAPRARVTAQPRPAPAPKAPRTKPVPAKASARPKKPRPAPVRSAPAAAADKLQVKLTAMTRSVERGVALDPSVLNTWLDAVQRRATATQDTEAARLVRRARDCLASCPTQEKMLMRAAQALAAVRRAE